MTWITTIPYDAATGRLRRLYERIKGSGDILGLSPGRSDDPDNWSHG